MVELINFLVKQFVSEEHYEVVISEDVDKVDVKVIVDAEFAPKLIGKGGKLAKAIRTIVKNAGQKSDKAYSLFIEERGSANA